MNQDIVIALTRSPYGRIHVPEGLRAAHGIASGFDRHDVTVVFTEDGIYAARASVDRDALDMADHVAALFEQNGELVADSAAMAERGIETAEIAADVTVRTGDDVAELLRAADHNLTL